ncbi:MAG: ABC transporter, permease protein 2 (cluster 1, maltose/g3p/polyamine/iron), partial [uncultured Friedmanniella sp.]
ERAHRRPARHRRRRRAPAGQAASSPWWPRDDPRRRRRRRDVGGSAGPAGDDEPAAALGLHLPRPAVLAGRLHAVELQRRLGHRQLRGDLPQQRTPGTDEGPGRRADLRDAGLRAEQAEHAVPPHDHVRRVHGADHPHLHHAGAAVHHAAQRGDHRQPARAGGALPGVRDPVRGAGAASVLPSGAQRDHRVGADRRCQQLADLLDDHAAALGARPGDRGHPRRRRHLERAAVRADHPQLRRQQDDPGRPAELPGSVLQQQHRVGGRHPHSRRPHPGRLHAPAALHRRRPHRRRDEGL